MNDSDIYMLVTEEKIDPRIISANFNISLDRINQIINEKKAPTIIKTVVKKHNIPKPVQRNDTLMQSKENTETGSTKMDIIRKNYQFAYNGNSLPKKKKKLQELQNKLSTNIDEILKIAISDNPDIERAKTLFLNEASSRGSNTSKQERQVYILIRKIFETNSSRYIVNSPDTTLSFFRQLYLNRDLAYLLRMISINLAHQNRVEEAISFCKKNYERKNRFEIPTELDQQINSIIKSLRYFEIGKLVMNQINSTPDQRDIDDENFMNKLEEQFQENHINKDLIWLGKDKNNLIDITLSDIWYDKDLSLTDYLSSFLKEYMNQK